MRILVADDEPIEREALQVLVRRHLPQVEIVGEAGSGRQAVELADRLHPDVILMDIEMPGLTGLEALKEIRARHPEIRCLIVSAYDHFPFAQEALRLGAADYLLKPVKRDQMLAVLARLEAELARERQRLLTELQQKEQLRQLRPLAEAELAQLLEQGRSGPPVESLLQLLGLRFEAGLCLVLGLRENSFAPEVPAAARPGQALAAHAALRAHAHTLCSGAVGPWQQERVTLWVELDTPVDEYRIRLWSLELGRRLRDKVRDQTGVRLRVGIGRPYPGLEGLTRSHREALAALDFEGVSEKVNHYGDLTVQQELPPLADGATAPVRWRPTPAVLRAVERGKQYVREHFATDITLERVAQEVALTPYYYGKIFSKVAGETLLDYLTRVRVEAAKKLLGDPLVSIKEACFAVGYNDPNYFSRVFKKVTGQTPTEYRAGLAPAAGPGR